MLALVITAHALDRYVERIGGTAGEAFAVLSGPAMRRAVDFGARCVRLPASAERAPGRILISFDCNEGGVPVAVITTVVPLSHLPAQLLPHGQGGPPPAAAVLAQLQRKAT